MTEVLKVSLTETELFLIDKYGKGVSTVQPLGEGGWSYAFSYLHDGVKNVIRWGNVPDNFERDAFAYTFSTDGLPVVPITEMGKENNNFYAVSPFIVGDFLEVISSADLESAIPSIIKMFRALRAVDMSTSTGYGFWNKNGKGNHDSWKGFLRDDGNSSAESLIKGWREHFQSSPLGAVDAYDKLWGKFQGLLEYCPEDRGVVHSDTVNKNVLVADGKITAVLDWGSSFFGDPLCDIAWLMYCEPWFPNSKNTHLIPQLLEDFRADPTSNTENMDKRLLCYQLNIAVGSIAYNTIKKDWKTLQEVVDYSTNLLL